MYLCSEVPPGMEPRPIQDNIVVSVPLEFLMPLSNSIQIGACISSADGLGVDTLELKQVPTVPPERPRLIFDPPTGPADTAINAFGTGFFPSSHLSIVFDHKNVSTITANPDGSFTTTFSVPELPPDHYMVDAIGDELQIAVAMFTVTETHDVAVTSMVLSKDVVAQDGIITVNVTVMNQGDTYEIFNVTMSANETEVVWQTTGLSVHTSTTVILVWDSASFVKGRYAVSAVADIVDGEIDIADNSFVYKWATITITGDLDGNFRVDMGDITSLCEAFGSTLKSDGKYWHTTPCLNCPHSPNLDVDSNGQIDMGDIVTALDHFGQHYP
jgi:hypothetical protein